MSTWTPEYRIKEGKREKTGREWAEVMFVPNTHALLTDIFEPFRYIVVRERLGECPPGPDREHNASAQT